MTTDIKTINQTKTGIANFLDKYRKLIVYLFLGLTLTDYAISHYLIFILPEGWFSEWNPVFAWLMSFVGHYTFLVLVVICGLLALVVWVRRSRFLTGFLCFCALGEAVVVGYNATLLIGLYL